MKTMKSIWNKSASLLATAGVCLGTGSMSLAATVNDLPGGPSVLQLNLPPAVTAIAREQQWLHWFMLILCTVIFVAVFAVMFYSIWKHRKSRGHKPAAFHESVTVEIIWTVIPFIIVILMALPATKVVVAMKDTSNADVTIKATGMQWKWGYDYIKGEGEGIGFVSTLDADQREMSNNGGPKKGEIVDDYLFKVDNPLVVPVDKKVRIITTANDVIHAWSVPAFGVKQDAIPGFVRDTWFRADKIGVYRGQCSELCGKEHGFMPIVVEVVAQEKYDQWIAEQKKKTASSAMAAGTMDGTAVYEKYCTACHGAGVAGAPKFGDRVAWGPRLKQGQEVLYTHAIKGHNAMPPKGGAADMSDDQIKAAVDYLSAAGK